MTDRRLSVNEKALCLLMAVRMLLEDPESWTMGASARTEDGLTHCKPGSELAKRWCETGGLEAFGRTDGAVSRPR